MYDTPSKKLFMIKGTWGFFSFGRSAELLVHEGEKRH